MESEFVRVPKKIVDQERDVLNRTIMRGKRIQEKVVPERFEDEKGAFDEWVVAR